MLCGSNGCGCAVQSSTLSITGSGTPDDPWVVEQAEFTDLTALQLAVDALEAWQTTAMGEISDLQTDVAANTTAIARLDAMAGGFVNQAGAGVGPVAGTAVVIATANPGPFAVAGTLFCFGFAVYAKTVNTDTFSVYARVNGVDQARGADRTQLTAGWASAMSAFTVAAGNNPIIDVTLVRDAGTGTATTSASTNAGGIRYWFVPN